MGKHQCTKERLKNAEKERDFVHAVEDIPCFQGWEQGPTSHRKGKFKLPTGDQVSFPYAAHSGVVSSGVRSSWVKFLVVVGILSSFVCLLSTELMKWLK